MAASKTFEDLCKRLGSRSDPTNVGPNLESKPFDIQTEYLAELIYIRTWKMGLPFAIIYSGPKFALDGFFNSGLRQELKMKNSDVSITLCILGLIGTETSLNQLLAYGQGHLIDTVNPVSPSDTALAVIKGGALRAREIYYPRLSIQCFVMLRDWFTSFLEYMNRSVYTKIT